MAHLTYFWDLDRQVLPNLSFPKRVDWLRDRMKLMLLEPIALLEEAEKIAFSWLAITELVCAGIDAMGGFLGNSQFGQASSFCRFVQTFMHSDFSKFALDKDNSS